MSTIQQKEKKRSQVWMHFDKNVEDSVLKAICQRCGKRLVGDSKKGTSHLWRHLKIHGVERRPQDGDGDDDGTAGTGHLPRHLQNHCKKLEIPTAVGLEMILGCPKNIKAYIAFCTGNKRHATLTWKQWKENLAVKLACTNKEKQHKKPCLNLKIPGLLLKRVAEVLGTFGQNQLELKRLHYTMLAGLRFVQCNLLEEKRKAKTDRDIAEWVSGVKDAIMFLFGFSGCLITFLGINGGSLALGKCIVDVCLSTFEDFTCYTPRVAPKGPSRRMISGPEAETSYRSISIARCWSPVHWSEVGVTLSPLRPQSISKTGSNGTIDSPTREAPEEPETSYRSISIARCWSPVHWSEVCVTLSPPTPRPQSISISNLCFSKDSTPNFSVTSPGFLMNPTPNFNVNSPGFLMNPTPNFSVTSPGFLMNPTPNFNVNSPGLLMDPTPNFNVSDDFFMDPSPHNSLEFFMGPLQLQTSIYPTTKRQEGCNCNTDDYPAATTGSTGNQNWDLVPAQCSGLAGPCSSDEELD